MGTAVVGTNFAYIRKFFNLEFTLRPSLSWTIGFSNRLYIQYCVWDAQGPSHKSNVLYLITFFCAAEIFCLNSWINLSLKPASEFFWTAAITNQGWNGFAEARQFYITLLCLLFIPWKGSLCRSYCSSRILEDPRGRVVRGFQVNDLP